MVCCCSFATTTITISPTTEPLYYVLESVEGEEQLCSPEVITSVLNKLLGLNHTREYYFDDNQSWFREYKKTTLLYLLGQKFLGTESSLYAPFKSTQSESMSDAAVLVLFYVDIDARMENLNNLSRSLDNMLFTKSYAGEQAADVAQFIPFLLAMVGTEICPGVIDGSDFCLPSIQYDSSVTLEESIALTLFTKCNNPAFHPLRVYSDVVDPPPFSSFQANGAAFLFVHVDREHWALLYTSQLVTVINGGLECFLRRSHNLPGA